MKVKKIEYQGETLTRKELANKLGLTVPGLRYRLQKQPEQYKMVEVEESYKYVPREKQLLEYEGKYYTIDEFSTQFQIPRETVKYRVYKGDIKRVPKNTVLLVE